MAFSDKSSACISDLCNISELDIISYYIPEITQIPILINSPLRPDNHPSFGLSSSDGEKIHFKDFATQESGSIYDLLSKKWNIPFKEVINKIYTDLPKIIKGSNTISKSMYSLKEYAYKKNSVLQVKVREWESYDLEYWNSYGITKQWLDYAEVYPISHKFIIKDGIMYTFGADKYAYAYIERKENNITIKVYQPFNTKGFKWISKHDSSVISLWTKVPKYGDKICICASVKDALCLSCNTKIPAIALQGEGYTISNTAINELKRRYQNIYILFDRDIPGMQDAKKLAEQTGFTNLILPNINNTKDISDLYKSLNNKNQFNHIILKLFKQ